VIVPVRGLQEREGLAYSIGAYGGRVFQSEDSCRSSVISFQVKESAKSTSVEEKTQDLKQGDLSVFF